MREAEWREYVEAATREIGYSPGWTRLLEQTFGYRRHHLFAIDSGGAVTGFLPLFHVRSRITGDRLCAAPFTPYCGPLGSDEARTALLSAACQAREDLGIASLEIHDRADHGGFQTFNWYSTYLLDLTAGPESLRKQRFSKNIQRGISQAEKMGLEVVRSRGPEDLAAFSRMNLRHKKNLGVLGHPRRFFENLFSHLPGVATLYLARLDGEILAGCIFLRFRDHTLYGYGASTPSSRDTPAMKGILWQGIRDACTSGGLSFDFGRVSYSNEGLIRFKRSWGAEERKLYYSYSPAPSGNMFHHRDTLVYRLVNAAVRAMPFPLFSRLSDRYFGIFG